MITSTSNPQVKNVILLGKKAKARREQGVFLTEGRKMLKEAPAEWVKKIFVSQSFLEEDQNRECLAGREYEIVTDAVFRAMSDTQTPQGVLTVAAIPDWKFETVTEEPNGTYLFLESIQDPGNLGTMIRTGEGAGIRAVIANKTTVDLYNPKTVRATMGSIYRVPFFVAEDFAGVIREMKAGGMMLYAAHLAGSIPYDEPDYRESCGFLIGNEGNGLTKEAAELADTCIRIPMEGKVESLNAAIAATILMYEANRRKKENNHVSVMGKRVSR